MKEKNSLFISPTVVSKDPNLLFLTPEYNRYRMQNSIITVLEKEKDFLYKQENLLKLRGGHNFGVEVFISLFNEIFIVHPLIGLSLIFIIFDEYRKQKKIKIDFFEDFEKKLQNPQSMKSIVTKVLKVLSKISEYEYLLLLFSLGFSYKKELMYLFYNSPLIGKKMSKIRFIRKAYNLFFKEDTSISPYNLDLLIEKEYTNAVSKIKWLFKYKYSFKRLRKRLYKEMMDRINSNNTFPRYNFFPTIF
uniref:Uncharacterized protein n=1 Tax=Neotessella volvocina TaxID=52559 RepID=A0A3G2R040_9STRA|nr:hypothetical protein [Neotessella volvocina]